LAPDGPFKRWPVPDFLTPAEIVGKYPVVSLSLLYAALKSGAIPHYRLRTRKSTRGKYAVRECDFLSWLEGQRVTGSPGPSAPASSGPPASTFSELDPSRLARAWKRSPG
jgi:hypothetical protein